MARCSHAALATKEMNPAIRPIARAFVGATNRKRAINSVPVIGTLQRIGTTKGLVSTMDLPNQVRVVTAHLITIVRKAFLTPA